MKSISFRYLWLILFLEGLLLGVFLSLFASFPLSQRQSSPSIPKVAGFESASSKNKASSRTSHEDLLAGYKILHHTLTKEAQLQQLHWFRNVTFRGPTGELQRLMTLMHRTSGARRKELHMLFQLPPVIVLSEAPVTVMGDAIQGRAERQGMKELLFSEGTFNSRFVLLQAQATRMVAAVALSVEEKDTQPERKKWLRELANEFEGIRNELVCALDTSPSSCLDDREGVVARVQSSLVILKRNASVWKVHIISRRKELESFFRIWKANMVSKLGDLERKVRHFFGNCWQKMKARTRESMRVGFVPLSPTDSNSSDDESQTYIIEEVDANSVDYDSNLPNPFVSHDAKSILSASPQEFPCSSIETNTISSEPQRDAEKLNQFPM